MTQKIRRINMPATGTTKIRLPCGDTILRASVNGQNAMWLHTMGHVESDHDHPCRIHAVTDKDEMPQGIDYDNYLNSFDQLDERGRTITIYVFVEYEDETDEAFEEHQEREDEIRPGPKYRTH